MYSIKEDAGGVDPTFDTRKSTRSTINYSNPQSLSSLRLGSATPNGHGQRIGFQSFLAIGFK